MRLIDIDRVVSDYKGKNKSLQNVTWLELTAYEVKAIPIEWIKEHYGWLTMASEIIKDWEAERGADK